MDTGHGTKINFGTSLFTAEILDVTPPSGSRESINVSHMLTSSAHRFIPADLVDWGEFKFQCGFVPSTAPILSSAPEIITITFPDATKWSFSGFCTGYSPSVPMNDKMVCDITVKVDGNITVS